MTLRFPIDSPLATLAVFAALTVILVSVWFGARWNLANSASMRADRADMIPILTDLGPSDPQTHFAAAVLLEKTFNAEDAERSLEEYKTAAELSPNNFLVVAALARAYDRAGDTANADAAYKNALSLAPHYASVKFAYGNFLLRNGDSENGFRLIAEAAQTKPEYAKTAAGLALKMAGNDVESALRLLGDTPAMRAALSEEALSDDQVDAALWAWDGIAAEQKRENMQPQGELLAGKLAEKKQFRLALHVLKEIHPDRGLEIGAIADPSFENGIGASPADIFGWKIAAGREPQIALADRAHSGRVSLFFVFDSNRADAFRIVQQTVAAEPGSHYRLSAFYKSELKAAGDLTVHFAIESADGQLLGEGASFIANSDWTLASVEFGVPADAPDGIVIKLVRDKCSSPICPISGKLWLDDVSLTKS